MRFRKFRRLVHRLFDRTRNRLDVGAGSVCIIPKEADVTDTRARINGHSKLIVEPGASIRNVFFQIDSGSIVRISSGTTLQDVDVCVWNGSELSLGERCHVNNVNFVVEKGQVRIEADNRMSSGSRMEKSRMIVSEGTVRIEDHNVLKNSFWIRFGGSFHLGKYNFINEGTDIRSDESVTIGSYNMISFLCDIWDTNTHSAYSLEEKKRLFERDFPSIGRETKKPSASPVRIGDGNWIGKLACVLKGSRIGDGVTVGTRAIVSNQELADHSTYVSEKGRIIV